MQIFDIPVRPENELESRLWFKNYCAMCDREQKVMNEIIDSEEYIKWLSEFVSIHNGFRTDQLTSENFNLSEKDLENINSFRCFYNVISRYADYHYIAGDDRDKAGFSYYVKYNGIVYKIGTFAYDGLFYCKVADANLDDVVIIDFLAVMEEKNIGESSLIRERLSQLSDLVRELICVGVREDAIRDTVLDTIKLTKK